MLRTERAGAFNEPLGLLETLTIIGGGHVSLAFSKVMATLPFRIRLLDNRPDLPTMDTNVWVHERGIVDYDSVADHVPDGTRSWVVIMTYGHVHDRQVLEKLLGRQYAYLGVLGSKAKMRTMFADMVAKGVPSRGSRTGSLAGGRLHRQPHSRGDRHQHRSRDHRGPQRKGLRCPTYHLSLTVILFPSPTMRGCTCWPCFVPSAASLPPRTVAHRRASVVAARFSSTAGRHSPALRTRKR